MDRPRFVIEATEAESMSKQSNLSVQNLLPSLARSAQTLARPPISNFPVGAAGLGSDGRIFLGVNLEFPGVPLHHSVHAEQFLVANLAAAANNSPLLLRRFAVSATPCGHCRQFLQELRNFSDVQIFITSSENHNSDDLPIFEPLSSFLPIPFGPYDLLDKETPLILEPHQNRLLLSLPPSRSMTKNPNSDNLCNGFSELYLKNKSELKLAALEAANSSHSPYSECPSGVGLMDCEGNIYRGSYMESAAYNPSLGPVQAALVAYVAAGGGGYERIVAAVLVEREGALVRQEDAARMLLKVISPKCEFQVLHCYLGSNGYKLPSSCCV